MRAVPLAVPEIMLVETVLHRDNRGAFSEVYSRRDFEAEEIAGLRNREVI
jgi:dTDP-4-dehydrorhamnose 3,5-epimerase-like enzyme